MMAEKEICLIGAGGHAKVILALIEELGMRCTTIYDDAETLHGTLLCGIPVTGPVSALPDREDIAAVIAIGAGETRRRISRAFKNISWSTLVHPHSWVHRSVSIGPGSVVFAGSVIQPDSIIGAHTIVNTSVSIDHDCRIGDFCHVAPGCHIAGGVDIGSGVFCGIGSCITQYLSVCGDVTIGAGAAVTKDITEPGIYTGVPAKRHA
ncbi:MAG: acetyltransferase [Synergistes sp.]|nr:acetyltransferase [Synergistes sp.]